MYIVAIAWVYVVFMMAITESTAVAGVMAFALYGILPLTIILYIMGTPERKRRRAATEAMARATASPVMETGIAADPASAAAADATPAVGPDAVPDDGHHPPAGLANDASAASHDRPAPPTA